jgi:SAM-dependent methyltransferase
MDANNLEFDNASFDIVYGTGILHHLEFERALSEIRRVLKPGGTLIFSEPLDINPVGRVVRWLTPRARTQDEQPLRVRELRQLQDYFDCKFTFEGMFSVPVGIVVGALGLRPDNLVMRSFYLADRAILRIPGIQLWGRSVLIEGRRT